jgi:very-short-patch-repair endonuclease
MTLVSSFAPDQLPADGSSRAGYQLLREFVLFAAASGDRDVDQLRADPEMNPFELDVYERLLDAGLRVDTQYGVAGYRLDFAVRHPHQPGRHVLAVETDGATYHSGWTARERDRLRQQHLESLGWRFHRIWSTDYWRDPEAEIADVVSSVQTAVDRLADGLPLADEQP